MRGKMRRPSGDWLIDIRMISWVGMSVMSTPSKTMLPFARPRAAADRHHQGRLAGAVRPDQRDDLAFVDLHVDAAQRDDVAVVGLDPGDREEGAHATTSCSDAFDLLVLDAEIGGDHLGVVADEFGRTVGDLLAVVEDDDVVGYLHDDAHVVLDQKNRDVVLVADEAEKCC